MPLCFDSCQFIRGNFHAIRHQLSTNLDLDPLEGDENFVPNFLYSEFEPLNAINSQVSHEDIEAGLYDQTIQEDSLLLCFESFQFLWGKLHSKSSNEKLVGNQQSLSFNVEDETDGEILEQVINKKSPPEMIDEIILDIKPSLALDLQPRNTVEGQITDEGVAAEINDLMMQEDFVPFYFEAFHFIRLNLRNISKEKYEQPVGCHIVLMDTS